MPALRRESWPGAAREVSSGKVSSRWRTRLPASLTATPGQVAKASGFGEAYAETSRRGKEPVESAEKKRMG